MPKIDLGRVKGDAGTAATIAVGTVTTGPAGSAASVSNSGTSSAAVFDFVIPKGDPGAGEIPDDETVGKEYVIGVSEGNPYLEDNSTPPVVKKIATLTLARTWTEETS